MVLSTEAYAGVLAKEKLTANPDLQDADDAEFERLNLLCVKGLASEKRVCDYADTLISAMNPRATDEERAAHAGVPDPHPCGFNPRGTHDREVHYCELVNCVQQHKCRVDGYCYSSKCDGCRFGYPHDLCERTRLSFTKTKNGTVKADISYKRNDPWINRHNRTMLEYWKANVDITIIIDYHAAVSYLTKYIAKPESKGREMQNLFKAALINAPDTANPQSRLRSVMLKSIEGKNISKFEASRQLMGGEALELHFFLCQVASRYRDPDFVSHGRGRN